MYGMRREPDDYESAEIAHVRVAVSRLSCGGRGRAKKPYLGMNDICI